MRERTSRSRKKAERNLELMQEARQELEESKNVMRQLIDHRRKVYGGVNDSSELAALRKKAIEVLNNLFDDEVDPGKSGTDPAQKSLN